MSIPRYYVTDGWGHIFSDGRERDCRWVIDCESEELVRLQIWYGHEEGWSDASGPAWDDVQESLVDNGVFEDIERCQEAGRIVGALNCVVEENFVDTLPVWRTGTRFVGPPLGPSTDPS
jgi:hypothetical protein